MSRSLSPIRSFLPARRPFQSTTGAISVRQRALSDQDLLDDNGNDNDNDDSGSNGNYYSMTLNDLDSSSMPSDRSDHPPPGQHHQQHNLFSDYEEEDDSYEDKQGAVDGDDDDDDDDDEDTYQQERQDHNTRFRRTPDPSPHSALMSRATTPMLRALSEKDLFASPEFACLMPNDDSSSGHSSNQSLDEDDDDGEDDDQATPNSSTSSSSMGDSFGADDLDDDEIHSQRTERQRNHSISRSSTNQLGMFLQEQEHHSVTERSHKGSAVIGDEEESISRYSVSIMSINSTPFAIREGDEDGGDCDGNECNDAPLSPSMRRSLRSSVASTIILSTTEAFYGLLDEHDKLTMQHEDALVVMERRKVEKNRLTKVLHSKEGEYIERVDRVEQLQSRREKLEFDILEESAASQLRLAPSSETHHKLRRRQNEAWERLEKAVSLLEEYRTEGKHLLVDKLAVRPETTDEEVREELDRSRRRKTCDYLKQRLDALQEEVVKLSGKKKSLENVFPELIGQEIVVDDTDNSGGDEGTIITALTSHSAYDAS